MIDLRLFRIRAFSMSLVVNMLTVFVAIGYFLFVAQYLQLVLGLSPFHAGLWSVPPAIGFIVGSNLVPRIAYKVKPAYVISFCIGLAAIGLGILTQVAGSNGLAAVVIASVIISLGLAPVFGLTTELIVGSAPPQRAGAASGIAETASELGGALGISILGSIGIAIYRSRLADSLPADIPNQIKEAASDTLGAAVNVAQQLPPQLAEKLIDSARAAFVQGMQVAAVISSIVAVIAVILSLVMLKNVQRKSH
ncbi:MFS transporter [Candidatus Gottesmanbacteria bacterium]|nr:MFS transporter [Candidatus Gottesmanbacteria bacterium]